MEKQRKELKEVKLDERYQCKKNWKKPAYYSSSIYPTIKKAPFSYVNKVTAISLQETTIGKGIPSQ